MAPFQWNGANAKLPYSIIILNLTSNYMPNKFLKRHNLFF